MALEPTTTRKTPMTSHTRQAIHVPDGPPAAGPYSHAVKVGHLVYTAGQIGVDPATGELAEGGIEAQTRQVLRNLASVLAAAGSSLDQVIKTSVFMQDLGDFARMNATYAEFFPSEPPARTTVEVAALPRGAQVEIECVAIVPE
jgi:2-iminobutanoate/2-iminopropanoate deaminase